MSENELEKLHTRLQSMEQEIYTLLAGADAANTDFLRGFVTAVGATLNLTVGRRKVYTPERAKEMIHETIEARDQKLHDLTGQIMEPVQLAYTSYRDEIQQALR